MDCWCVLVFWCLWCVLRVGVVCFVDVVIDLCMLVVAFCCVFAIGALLSIVVTALIVFNSVVLILLFNFNLILVN